jgi:hypothetical protein
MSITLPGKLIEDDIYTGFWINHGTRSSHGATLTLNRQMGGLMIAFLALFIGAAARSQWKIVRFLLHAILAAPTSKDGLHHQRQAILRNTSLASDTALSLFRANMVWRNRSAKLQRRTLPIAFAALAVAIISALAGWVTPPSARVSSYLNIPWGVFSSKLLTSSTNEVLIAGRHCGVLAQSANSTTSTFKEPGQKELASLASQRVSACFAYAVECYEQQSGACDTYATSILPYKVQRNASCPFADKICRFSADNIILDSGVIDSISDLGLNDGPHFTVQHQTHCAPLKTEGYTEQMSYPNSTDRHFIYNYGNFRSQNYTHKITLQGNRKDRSSVSLFMGDYKVLWVSPSQQRSHTENLVALHSLHLAGIILISRW